MIKQSVNNIKILMLAPGFAPYSFSENIVNSKLALAFQNNGWEPRIITKVDEGPVYSSCWHEPWLPLQNSTHTVTYLLGNRFGRFTDLLHQVFKTRFPVEGVRWAGRALDLAMALHRECPFDVVLSRSPNDVGHVPALAFSKKTKIPWIANWNDPPAHLWPEPYKTAVSLLAKSTSQRLMHSVFKEASLITFPSENLRNHVLCSFKSDAILKKTRIVPHIGLIGYTTKKRTSDGYFRICHAGNLSKERNPEAFLAGVALFLKRAKISHSFEVLILGVNDQILDELIKTYKLTKHIKVSGGLSYLDTLVALEQSDVLTIIEAHCDEGIFLPSKVTDYAQVGRPILAVSPSKGTMVDLIRETRAGELSICGRPDSVADAISALYKSWCNGQIHNQYSTASLWERYRPEKITKQYEEMFSELNL